MICFKVLIYLVIILAFFILILVFKVIYQVIDHFLLEIN